MVRDLVHDDVADTLAEPTAVGAVHALDRVPEDGDLVRQRACVGRRPPRERHPLVEAENRLPRRRLLVDDDPHVGHEAGERLRHRRDRVLDQALELERGERFA